MTGSKPLALGSEARFPSLLPIKPSFYGLFRTQVKACATSERLILARAGFSFVAS
jgi:hypothetical protein